MKKFVFSLLGVFLLGVTAIQGVGAVGSELPITIESFTFKDPDKMRALDFETHEINIEWSYNNQVNEGDYFDIILDEQMKLAEYTILDLQESLVSNGIDYVDVSVVDVGSVHSIRYTFNNKADGLIVNGGVITFNNIARPMPEGTPIEDTDGHGHFKAGYEQTLTYMIGGTPVTQEITYIGYPIVSESIFYLNSWFNSKVLDRNVFWDPTIEGKLIQGYLEIHNAKQFQPGNIDDYGETSNLVLSQMVENEYVTINKEAGIKVSLERFDGAGDYDAFETHYVGYDDIEYVDDGTYSTFTIDFEKLGIVDKKDQDVRIMVVFYMDHKRLINYKENGNRTNLATLFYEDKDGETRYFEEAAFWYPDVASSEIYAEPVHTLTSVKITKDWITNNGEIPDVDIEFELYADGVRVIEPNIDYVIKSGETELVIQRLPYYRIDETGRVPIVYTVKEIEMVGFDIELEQDKNLFKFTNIEYPLINFTVDKVWKGGSSPRPDIEIQLYQDGIAYLDSIILKDGETSFTWNGLPSKDIDGNVHVYTADELTILEDYTKELNDDGSVIVNTLIADELPDPGDRDNPPTRQEGELPNTGFANMRMIPFSLIALGGVILLSDRRRRK